jgi:hypothetical protein
VCVRERERGGGETDYRVGDLQWPALALLIGPGRRSALLVGGARSAGSEFNGCRLLGSSRWRGGIWELGGNFVK